MIALAGPNLPHAVLKAAGCHGGALPIAPDRAIDGAARYLEGKFMPWAFCALEAWLAGEYDHFDAVLFSRADDTSQRLYYYVCELQRRGLLGGPEPLIFDVAKIARSSSVDHTALQVRRLAERLGVDDAALLAAMAEVHPSSTPAGNACLLAGTPLPDRRLAEVVEVSGSGAVATTLADDWLRPTPVSAEIADPFTALATALNDDPRGPRSFASSADLLAADIAACRARAVVLWRIEEDEAQTWHLPAERRVLADSGVPHLVLTRRDWLARDGAAEEIGAFLQEIAA